MSIEVEVIETESGHCSCVKEEEPINARELSRYRKHSSKRCDRRKVFEYVVVDGDEVVRQDVSSSCGIPEQRRSSFLFGPQNPSSSRSKLYYNPRICDLIVGDGPYKDIENLVYIGKNNTIETSLSPKVIGSCNKILRTADTEVFGYSNVVKDSVNALVIGDKNKVVSKDQIVIVGNENKLPTPSLNEKYGAVFGSKNKILSDEEIMDLTNYSIVGIKNKVKSPDVHNPTITGIKNKVKATEKAHLVSIHGDDNNITTKSTIRNDTTGVKNAILAPGLTTKDTIQHGIRNVIEFISEGEANLEKVMQVGVENVILGDYSSDLNSNISYLSQDGNENLHFGYARNSRQAGGFNTEQIRNKYVSTQTGHGNITEKDIISVDEYLGGEMFPETRLLNYRSTTDTVGTANVTELPNNRDIYHTSVGAENKVSIGGEDEAEEAKSVVSVLGRDNVAISDVDTAVRVDISGDDNKLLVRGSGISRIVEDVREPVVRTVLGSGNEVETDRSQTNAKTTGHRNICTYTEVVSNNMVIEGTNNTAIVNEGTLDNLDIEGANNTAIVDEGTLSNLGVEGYGNIVIISDSNYSSIRVEGTDNIFSSPDKTGNNVSMEGTENSAVILLDTISINQSGNKNIVQAPGGTTGRMCNSDQRGVNNCVDLGTVLDRGLGTIVQYGTGNISENGDTVFDEIVETVGTDQIGASNYVVTSNGYTGYVTQHGATNFTDAEPEESDLPSQFPRRYAKLGGVMDFAPNGIPISPVNLQYEKMEGYGFLSDDGIKSMFREYLTKFGIGYIYNDIISASITEAPVGRGLGHNAQSFNGQGTGYATMFNTGDGPLIVGRFVTIDTTTGSAILAIGAGDDLIGVSSVNAAFRSFEWSIYNETYYEVENDQRSKRIDVSTKVSMMKEALACFCCKADFLQLTTEEDLVVYARRECPEAVGKLLDIAVAPDEDYEISVPETSGPLPVWTPKTKDGTHVEVTHNGVVYIEHEVSGHNYMPGDRIINNPGDAKALFDEDGPYIYVNEPFFGDFIPVTRLVY